MADPSAGSVVLELPSTSPLTTVYSPDASVFLVGFPGAGKRTLGVMASVALRRRYVDFGSVFEKWTGLAPHDHMSAHGIAAYRQEEARVTKSLLESYSTNCVIAGLTGLGSNAQRGLLRTFSQTHPVIYIQRDKADISGSIEGRKGHEQLYRHCDAFYRSCSNFDFYNISYNPNSPNGSQNHSTRNTLKLKQTEIDFVRFLRRIFGHPPKQLLSGDPLSSSFSYVLQISLDWLETHFSEYDQLEAGADVVGLVIDSRDTELSTRLPQQFATLRRHTRAPILIDVGYSDIHDLASYFELLRLCLRCVPDFLTVALKADRIQTKMLTGAFEGITQIVGTYHHAGPVGVEIGWSGLHDLAKQLGCRAVRITRDATSPTDGLQHVHSSQVLRNHSMIPLIAYSTGREGRASMCFNPVLSPVVLPSMSTDGITITQAQAALYSSFILSRKRFTILGSSVSYTLSPAMHNAAYAYLGMPHSYGLLQSNDLDSFKALLRDVECGGVTVSLPFKTEVLPMLDTISEEARDIGAVNTVAVESRRNDQGQWVNILRGYNTDHIGIRECIEWNTSPANSIREGSTALIIGAGGMARAAIYACKTLGLSSICIYNRTPAHAERLADHYRSQRMDVQVLQTPDLPWPSGLRQPTVIVSCIPAHSINGQPPSEMTVPDHWLQSRSGGVSIELAYKPLVTGFMKQMQLRSSSGWIVVDGLEVLVAQGIAQFEIYTGKPAPVHVMRKAVRQQYELIQESERPRS